MSTAVNRNTHHVFRLHVKYQQKKSSAQALPTKAIFSAKRLNTLLGPCVYIFRNKDQALYVGSSAHGLTRPLTPDHISAQRCLEEYTTFEIIPYATIEEARKEEVRFIKELNPKFNIQCKIKPEPRKSYRRTWVNPNPLIFSFFKNE